MLPLVLMNMYLVACIKVKYYIRGKEKSDQNGLLYILFWEGQMVAKSNNIGVQCLRKVGVWCSIIEMCRNLIVEIAWCSIVVGVWQFISNSFLLACSMLFASTLLPVCFLLPVVYFVVEIASMG